MFRAHRAALLALACVAASSLTAPVLAQEAPTKAVVSIYRVAPGKQLDFLKWMAAREVLDREAGVAASQWYAHMSGDSWDFIVIGPDLDDATSDKVDELARKRGLKTGPQAGLEFRQMMASHTDTLAAGPYTASQLIEHVTKP